MPKISVIVPCYNAEKHICKCLEALEKQTYRDFEVIIVNDYSNDRTELKIKEFKKNSKLNIKYIKNSINYGPGESRNIGIINAKSELISFCDSDDWYEEKYLEKMIYIIDSKSVDIAFCGYNQVFDNSKRINKHPLTISENLTKKEQIVLNIDSLCNIIIKKEIAEIRKIPSISNGEDMAIIPFWILNSKSYAVINDCLYNYRCHKESISNNLSEKVIASLKESFKYIKNNMPIEYRDECEFLGIRNFLYGSLLGIYKYSNNNNKAKSIIDSFEIDFPYWWKNKYIKKLPLYKKVFLFFAKNRALFLIKFLSKIHSFLR